MRLAGAVVSDQHKPVTIGDIMPIHAFAVFNPWRESQRVAGRDFGTRLNTAPLSAWTTPGSLPLIDKARFIKVEPFPNLLIKQNRAFVRIAFS